MHRAVIVLHRSLWILGVGCLGTWATVTVLAHSANARNAALLARLIRENRAADASVGVSGGPSATLPEGTLLGRIDVPRLGVSTVILEGTSERVLEQAAGHIPGTALPGQDGNVGLAGHRDSFFRGLRDVFPGDTVSLTTPTQRRDYVVRSSQVVDPDDTAVLGRIAGNALALVTCYPFRYVGSAPRRFVVLAQQVGDPLPATAPERLALAPAGPHPSPHVTRAHASLPYRPADGLSPRSGRPSSARPPGGAPRSPTPSRRLHWWQRLFHRSAKPMPTSPSR